MNYKSPNGEIQFTYDAEGNVNNLDIRGNHFVYFSNKTLIIDGRPFSFANEPPAPTLNIFQKISGKILAFFDKVCMF
jgi:hypothetical protein